jgi:valyl-tRNA synthetase
MKTYRSVDVAALPKHFESEAVEKRWGEVWEREGTYRYDPSRPREQTFVVDTPPPTVSGSLHIGHVFSYTQTDLIVRFWRMRGKNTYYPMGWDDNGLPTERRVQNHFNVRVDVKEPHRPGLSLPPAPEEGKGKATPPKTVSRPNFIELCHEVTKTDEKVFMALWRRLGLSVDWEEEYATIDDRCRKLAQLSFRDLYEKGHVYSEVSPTMWDVDFQTAVAQAEVEDRPQAGAFHDIAFAVASTRESFIISTTRPELLPACVAVAAHPDDPRYQHLIGKKAVTPLFHAEVPIFASPAVERDKGTGVLMICTFGDATDVM